MYNCKITRYVCFQIMTIMFAIGSSVAAEAPVNFPEELVKIAAKTNAVERLAAYDALAAKVPPSKADDLKLEEGPGKTVTKHGKWTLYASISPIDDKQVYTAVLEADAPVRVRYREIRPRLVIRLRDGQRLATYVDYGVYLGLNTIDATVRYGTEKAKQERWTVTSSHDAAFAAMSPDSFVAKLKKTDKLLIQLNPPSEGLILTTFTLDGINDFADTIIKQWKK